MKHLERWAARQSQDETAWGLCVEGTERKPVWIIHPTKELDDQDAALIMAAHNAAVEKRPERMIEVNSITNTRLEPIVQIVLGPEVAQFKLPEAQQLAQQFLEVIEAAQSDALLCRFVRDYIYHGEDSDPCKHAIGNLLVMFRDFRKSFIAPDIQPGERVYVVCEGKLRGYSKLVRIERYERSYALVRHNDSEAVTIDVTIQGFRGFRYRFWKYEEERPFPEWRTP